MSEGLERDLLVVVCAVSAGVHGALAPEHLGESAAAGGGFIAAAALLLAFAVALTVGSPGRPLVGLCALTLAGSIVSYALVAWRGLPIVHPDVEPVGGLAVGTKMVEALGLGLALSLLGGLPRPRYRPIPLPLTLLIAVFSALVALALTGGRHMSMGMQ